MKKNFTIKKNTLLTALFYFIALAGSVAIFNACSKGSSSNKANDANTQRKQNNTAVISATSSFNQNEPITKLLTVAAIRTGTGSNAQALFLENTQILQVSDPATLAALQHAYHASTAVMVTFDPWKATVISVTTATPAAIAARQAERPAAERTGYPLNLKNITDDVDSRPEIGVINTTGNSLNAIIPDMATAQLMFNYIQSQCCRLPGPYAIDYCITFQYCPDGCYARAHKMCWILNTKYHYATQKIFSFANAGSDVLSVKAERWGGCCINWWYHVAPLVTIQTTTGPKAFVIDPAMFNQPVLLSQWLHAQENPACSSTPHVSMINVQPTSSYSPSSYSGYTFDTDPVFASTDTTLVNYRSLVSCP